MTILNANDLEFLLRQVNIGVDYSQLVNALDPRGVREVSGTNMNLAGSNVGNYDPNLGEFFIPGPNTNWGAADQPFLRLSNAFDELGNPVGATYFNYNGNVSDTSPRIISNLVSNSWTEFQADGVTPTNNPYANPAADAALATWGGDVVLDPNGNDTAFVSNVGPLGAASYNNWFTFFGQFFDHGLDFIEKDGSSGFIEIPLTPNDPLYGQAPGNVMMISRANLANSATDYDNGDPLTGNLIAGIEPIYNNNTGLLIDQSQTYGSHPTINAFLREYDANGVPTGRVLTGNTALGPNDPSAVGLSTWADIKINAARIGITLTDADVLNAPEVYTDAAGRLTDAAGNYVTTAVLTGNLTGHAFLIDINPAAHPAFAGIPRTEDGDSIINNPKIPDFDPAGGFTYDNELLDAHYVVGDGRGK